MAVTTIIARALIAVFGSLSLVHVYWLLGGRVGQRAAIPEIGGQPVFQPSALASLVVAMGLALCAVVIAGTAGVLILPLSQTMLVWLTRALAVVLLARAIGDFRLVGFFKRIRDTPFCSSGYDGVFTAVSGLGKWYRYRRVRGIWLTRHANTIFSFGPARARDGRPRSSQGLDHDGGMTYGHTRRHDMARSKIAISLDASTLERLDTLVERAAFPSRSQAIQEAVEEKLARLERGRLARECAKLDPVFEQTLADEGLSEDVAVWPEY